MEEVLDFALATYQGATLLAANVMVIDNLTVQFTMVVDKVKMEGGITTSLKTHIESIFQGEGYTLDKWVSTKSFNTLHLLKS